MKLSIVICTYKRPDLITALLGDIEDASVSATNDWELIFVDNAGDVLTKDICSRSPLSETKLKYFYEPKVGLSSARNRGATEALGRWLLYLDDDVRFENGFITKMLEAIDNQEGDIICPRLITPLQSDWPRWLKTRVKSGVGQFDLGDRSKTLDETTKIPVGACMCFRKSVYEKFGPFSENIGRTGKKLFGGEETILFGQAFKNSVRGVYLPSIVVRHEFISAKNTKEYWRNQGFYGGRSTVRMFELRDDDNVSRLQLLNHAATSLIKSISRAVFIVLSPTDFFENQYRAIAHFGNAYEAIVAVFQTKSPADRK